MKGSRHVHRPGGMFHAVVRELDRNGSWMTSADIAAKLFISPTYARDLLRDAVTTGYAEKDSPLGKRWRIVRRGHATNRSRDIALMLSPAQLVHVIDACTDRTNRMIDEPYVQGSQARLRALENALIRMREAMPKTGR